MEYEIDNERKEDAQASGMSTGIYVRAKDDDQKWHLADIVWLKRASLVAWLDYIGTMGMREVFLGVLGHVPRGPDDKPPTCWECVRRQKAFEDSPAATEPGNNTTEDG